MWLSTCRNSNTSSDYSKLLLIVCTPLIIHPSSILCMFVHSILLYPKPACSLYHFHLWCIIKGTSSRRLDAPLILILVCCYDIFYSPFYFHTMLFFCTSKMLLCHLHMFDCLHYCSHYYIVVYTTIIMLFTLFNSVYISSC